MEWAAAQSEAVEPDDVVNGLSRLSEQLVRDGAFMSAVLAGSGDCIKVLSLDARLEFLSAGGLGVMEIDDFGTFAGCPWPGFWQGDGNAAAHEAVKKAKAGGVGRFRGFAKTAKGTPKWWDVQVAPIPGSDGRPAKLLSNSRDITEEHRATTALILSEARHRAILESSTDYAIVASDHEGRVTVWNEGARRIMGWTEAEVLGIRTHRMFTPEDIADGQPEWEMKRAVDQGHATGERWHRRKDGSRFWASGLMTPLRIESGEHIGYLKILRDRTAERLAEEHGKLLAAELQHRVKNTLAMVQAIASQTFREVAPTEVRAAFTARMVALGDAHDILTQANWTAAPLRDVARAALSPHEDGENRFDLEGPNVRLAAKPALALALALHELATNAAKYGALSNDAGRVEVTWRIEDERFRFRWAERGGPAVSPPNTKGFGSRLIERSLAAEFGSTTSRLVSFAGSKHRLMPSVKVRPNQDGT